MKDNLTENQPWPRWARWSASLLLFLHFSAVVAAAVAAPPSSPLERLIAGFFRPYNDVVYQIATYRFFNAGPLPTPIVVARLRMSDGQVQEFRIPPVRAQDSWPPLRRQRRLAMAQFLMREYYRAPRTVSGATTSLWPQALARHFCRRHPDADSVTVYLQPHLNLSLPEIIQVAGSHTRDLSLEAEHFYAARVLLGEWACD